MQYNKLIFNGIIISVHYALLIKAPLNKDKVHNFNSKNNSLHLCLNYEIFRTFVLRNFS
jgi:hypothetical protein